MIELTTTFDAILGALGIAIVHFLWQGAAIGLVAFAALACLARSAPAWRYALSCAALGACFVWFAGTFLSELDAALRATRALVSPAAPLSEATATGVLPPAALGVVAWVWAGGVVCFATRFAFQWLAATRLRLVGVDTPGARYTEPFESLCQRMRLRPGVRLLRSTLAEAPMVVGWLRPVVLVPASCFTTLTPDQLHAVLAHELAHIARRDHWINAAQIFVESVLFFHPVVWWLSGRVRVERELCCDDDALRAVPGPHVLAGALAQLESLRHTHTPVALSANGGILMTRIHRILGTHEPSRRAGVAWRTAAALAAGAAVSFAGIAHAMHDGATADPTVEILRDAVETGAMAPDDARAIYETVVLPGSEHMQKIRAELDRMNAEIDAALADGRISPEEADEKRAEMARGLEARSRMMFDSQVLGLSKEEIHERAVSVELHALVERGDITPEQAEERLRVVRERRVMREHIHAHIVDVKTKIHEAVLAGEITPEEGEDQLHETLRGIELRVKYHDAENKLRAMVDAGDLTEQQMRDKLAELRRGIGVSTRVADEAKAIRDAVHAGELTRDEAERKLRAIHEKAMGEFTGAEARRTLNAHEVAAVDLDQERLVLETKLRALESKLAESGTRDAEAWEAVRTLRERLAAIETHMGDLEAARANREAIKRRVDSAVERGELTRAEADEISKRMKERMASRTAR